MVPKTHLLGWRLVPLVIASACCLVAAIAVPATASWADDGREVSPNGELRAFYQHALNRAPDPEGERTYINLVEKDCKAGVLRFSYDILTSSEAEGYLRAPDRQTNAIYMTLLNRAPDSDGSIYYLAMNRNEGIDRSIVDIMASQEYHNRLTKICQGRESSTVGVLNGDEVAQSVNNLLTGASVGSVACGINTLVKKLSKLKGKPNLGAIAAYSADLSAKITGPNATCKLAKQTAMAAVWMAYISSRDHPVYAQEIRSVSTGWISKKTTYTWHIGWTPADTRTFGPGSVKGLRW